ncbi:MAG: DMT family transporter [Kineosporiaceae bacterium]
MLEPDPHGGVPARPDTPTPTGGLPVMPPQPAGVPALPMPSEPAARRSATVTTAATASLVAVTAVWGSTFPIITSAVRRMPAADFLAVRFGLAAVLLTVLLWRQARATSARGRATGLLLGTVYGGGQLLQTTGMATSSPSVAGFLTGIYVVLTPMLAWLLLRHRIGTSTWLAVALSSAGLGVLGYEPSGGGVHFGTGELLVLTSALLYALHIVGLGAWARAEEVMGLAVWQMVAIAAVCLIGALPSGVQTPPDAGAWGTAIYTAAVAGAGALLVQTWAQSHLDPSRAALVMTLEPVFATAFAVTLGDDRLTGVLVLGGVLILGAMVLVEVLARDPRPA